MPSMQKIDCSFGKASVSTTDQELIVSTGCMQRVFIWTGSGFATKSITEIASGQTWQAHEHNCDWQLPDGSEPPQAERLSLVASMQNDDGFTSEHIALTAEIQYPHISIRWTIWVYPNAPGIRTQLAAKYNSEAAADPNRPQPQGGAAPSRNENVPITDLTAHRRFFGYYNGTQIRNDTHLDILKEEVLTHALSYKEWCNWANAACVETPDGGVALIKESHKCVNQGGYDSGGFIADETSGLACTGWGLLYRDLSDTAYTAGWATWQILWSGGDIERETAIKTFDKIRYPLDPERDIYMQANTWGSTGNSHDARTAACEKSVLAEIDTCAELGIDVLQVDDGWQVPPGHSTWEPEENGWQPHPQSYPQGWSNIRAKAKQHGIKLGLWAAAEPVSRDELIQNFHDGGFLQFKLDFAFLRRREAIDALMQKVRQFILATGHRVRVNWDVTENEPRYGYFFAREYGCIYLENRKPEKPASVIYRPHTVLRDIWQIAKYLNIHKFQCSIQNRDRVDPALSDAHLHTHAYTTAIALAGIPLFFQETKYLSPTARAEIRNLLSIYKEHRDAMFRSIVYPIGQKPDNKSWTGFQCHIPQEKSGYLLIFRERCNTQVSHTFQLAGMANMHAKAHNLLAGQTTEPFITTEGQITVTIPTAPDFLFIKYTF